MPTNHHRRSIRLQGYDYAQPGAYFVTICVQDRAHMLADVVDGASILRPAGEMVTRWWNELPHKFPLVETDAWIVMPNHVHGIITITDNPVGADLRVCPETVAGGADNPVGADLRVCPKIVDEGAHAGAPLHVCPQTVNGGASAGRRTPLHRVVQWFKTMTTNAYLRCVKQCGWPPVPAQLWQRNYYERVIRNEDELNRIREYIQSNPLKWQFDRENPNRRADPQYEKQWKWLEGRKLRDRQKQ